MIVGNKIDLPDSRREVFFEDVNNWALSELPRLRVKVIECSAKTDTNIRDTFKCFVTLSKIVPKNPLEESDDLRLRRRCSAYGSRR